MTQGGSSEIRVRRAVPEDLETIVRFNAAMALETEGKALDMDQLRSGVAAMFQRHGLGFYCVAEVDGQVVGQLMITTEWSDWRNSTYWWIQSVYVDAEHRRNGVYRTLHSFVTAEAKEKRGVQGLKLYVDRDNKRAQSVYASLAMTHSNYDLWEIDFESS
jgi:GNAT superfamily N-acetyltransferase